MTDYKKMVLEQRGHAKKDAYPNIMGPKMDKKQSEKEPDLDTSDNEVKEEGYRATEAEIVDNLVQYYQDGYTTCLSAVGQLNKNSKNMSQTILFLQTAALWAEQAFNEAKMQAMRHDRMRQATRQMPNDNDVEQEGSEQ
jgi:hypothetical protein